MQQDISQPFSTNSRFRKQAAIIVVVFIMSRLITHFLDLRFQYGSLYDYWQYLDVTTLKENLLKGVWYDHTQPPVFNLFLGTVLKIAPGKAPWIFAGIFKLVTLINTLLLFSLVQKITAHRWLPLAISLFYLLSPGTMVFENELFYTSLVSLLFLVCISQLLQFARGIYWKNAIIFSLALTLICLTRSLYHVFLFLCSASLLVFIHYRKQEGIKKLLVTASISLLIATGWYLKNFFIFGQFTASSWLGMNMARNIFHDNEVTDSSRIESIAPFSPISAYRGFIKSDAKTRFAGLNDRDLLQEMKNDTFRNEKHIDFIEVAELYKKAGIQHIKDKPGSFVKNVVQSGITFFAPATRYTLMDEQAEKIKYYDAAYSFNLSQFAKGKQQRRIALTLSAIPQMLLYLLVFWTLSRRYRQKNRIDPVNQFIMLVLLYVFCVSSLIEHYENMRFRFELTPLFLLLFAQALRRLLDKKDRQFDKDNLTT